MGDKPGIAGDMVLMTSWMDGLPGFLILPAEWWKYASLMGLQCMNFESEEVC